MKIYDKKYLLGDIHGYWSIIANHIVHNDEKNIAYLQVGDFGVGFDAHEIEIEKLTKLNEILKTYECDLYVVRGNHDMPDWFKVDNFMSEKQLLNRINFIPDYTVIEIDFEKILFVGGAVSIDRMPRMMSLRDSWWPDEIFVLDTDKLQSFEEIDRVITHTTTNFCEPRSLNSLVYGYAKYDADLLNDLRVERDRVTEMANILMLNGKNKIKGWYYGHFHNNYRFLHNNAEFVCLGINKFTQL